MMFAKRLEHCMYCGAVVSGKPADYMAGDWHVHFYYSVNHGGQSMIYTGIVCLDHLIQIDDAILARLKDETSKILPPAKSVNMNLSASAINVVSPYAYQILVSYLQNFGGRLIPGIVKEVEQ